MTWEPCSYGFHRCFFCLAVYDSPVFENQMFSNTLPTTGFGIICAACVLFFSTIDNCAKVIRVVHPPRVSSSGLVCFQSGELLVTPSDPVLVGHEPPARLELQQDLDVSPIVMPAKKAICS